ncbi:hypothetical protein [Massilia genomosp. 1]|uniref:Fimbrial assembly protein n=1 Tax=Massilia genomosp. 1 TaxID=2609280 RepID=A0ABX0N744_9BURK|nr:hypothetical protein [Massilia genomosp. 1]NHZ65964.1 hypothetical protein [Massilia genomosp. 1]
MSQADSTFAPSGDTLLLVIGAERIEWAVRAGAGGQWRADCAGSAALAPGAGDDGHAGEDLAGALGRLAVALPPAAMRVVVADNWLTSATLPWSSVVERGVGLDGAARARLAAAGAEIGGADTVRVDPAPFGAPRAVHAYPAVLLALLNQTAARLGTPLASVLPLSVACWEYARRHGARAPAALAVQDAGLLMLARRADAAARHMADLLVRHAPQPDAAAGSRQLLQLWQRQCLRDPQLATLEQVTLLDLAADGAPPPAPFVAPAWDSGEGAAPSRALQVAAAAPAHRLDALPRRSGLTPLRMAALALLALVTLAALLNAVQASRTVAVLRERLEAAPARASAAAPAPAWSRTELARVQAVNVAIRELNLPFPAILRALAPPPDLRVSVLSVTTAASQSAAQPSHVKLVAEAGSGAEMARYVAFLAERAPFTGAYLTEHEIDETSPGRPYRFTVEATWKE